MSLKMIQALLLLLLIVLSACGENSDPEADGDADIDIVEAETESDSEASGDGDTDTEVDIETEIEIPLQEPDLVGRDIEESWCPYPYNSTQMEWPEGWQQDADCASEAGDPVNDLCRKHSECTEKSDGFCSKLNDESNCSCFYHDCATDSDCQASEACACNFLHGTDSVLAKHVCAPSSCRSDDECDEGQMCAVAGINLACSAQILGSPGYRCTSDADQCHNQGVCNHPEKSGNLCLWNEEQSRFTCYWDYDGANNECDE